jgi:hypothetical protein
LMLVAIIKVTGIAAAVTTMFTAIYNFWVK